MTQKAKQLKLLQEKSQTTAQQLNTLIKSARDIMRKDKGLSGELDRIPMLTWIMFLKFLDDMEHIRESEAELAGKDFHPLIDEPYRWRDWAADEGGITGDDLINFINLEEANLPDGTKGQGLFHYLRNLRSTDGKGREDVIATVFKGIINRIQSGWLLRDIINKVNSIHFDASEEMHTLSRFYETMLREMRDAAKGSGEFYTPRPVVKFIVAVTNLQLGETVLDPACGTGGFLVEAFTHLEKQCQTIAKRQTLQESTIYGIEAKPMSYLLGQMNLLLHGLENPQIEFGNSLTIKRYNEIGDSDRYDVILTNPPFGGEEEVSVKNYFPTNMQTAETALLFLQIIMRRLKRPERNKGKPGRAAIVVPNGTLFEDGVCARIKEELLKNFNLHTIVRLPKGVFAPYTGIPTNLLFFDRSHPTKEIWFYEIPLPEGRKNYTKTKPMRFEEFSDCIEWFHPIAEREENEYAWKINVNDVLKYDEDNKIASVNLDIKNPNNIESIDRLPPMEITESIIRQEQTILELLEEVKSECVSVYGDALKPNEDWVVKYVSELCEKPQYGYTASSTTEQIGPHFLRITDIQGGSVNWETVPYCDCPKPEKYLLQKDDILFARTGPTGRSFLVQECPTAVFASYLIRLRVRKWVTPQYLYAFFQSPYYWAQVSENTSVSAQPNCNATKLSNLKVPVPPLEQQQNIVTYLNNFQEKIREKVNRIKALQTRTAHDLDEILPSAFDKVFRRNE